MKLIIDGVDCSAFLMEWPRMVLDNQVYNRFTIISSVSNLKLKKALIPTAIFNNIVLLAAMDVQIYNDYNQQVFAGYYPGKYFNWDQKNDIIDIEVVSNLSKPNDIDFVYDDTVSISEFLAFVTGKLGENGLWKAGSYSNLSVPYLLKVHWPIADIWNDLLTPTGVLPEYNPKIALGMINVDEIGDVPGIEITFVVVTTTFKLYAGFNRRELDPISTSDVNSFTPLAIGTNVQDKGFFKQVYAPQPLYRIYYVDLVAGEVIPPGTILWGLIGIYSTTDVNFDNIQYHFEYQGKLGDALLDIAKLTDSNIYYDEIGRGFIVPQAFQLGSKTLDSDYIINNNYRAIEEDTSAGVDFKGVEMDSTVLEEYNEYYRQRGIYDKQFYRNIIEVAPYEGIDDIHLFADIGSGQRPLKIEKTRNKYTFEVS